MCNHQPRTAVTEIPRRAGQPPGAFAAAIQHERTLPGWLYWLSIVAAVLGVASATTMLGPTNNSSLVYGILLLAAVLLFAWLVASSLVLVRRAHRPR